MSYDNIQCRKWLQTIWLNVLVFCVEGGGSTRVDPKYSGLTL
jgi:hypothetical protein